MTLLEHFPRTLTVAFVLILAAAGTAFSQAASTLEAQRQQADPATRFEQFSSKKGRLLVKTSYPGGEVRNSQGSVRVRGVSIGAPGEQERVYAVVFETEGRGAYPRSSSAVLDFDEAVSLLQAVERMMKMAGEMASSPSQPYTEILFETRSSFQAGFYQSEGKQTSFVKLERFGNDGIRFGDLKMLEDLRASVTGVVDQLRTVGAR